MIISALSAVCDKINERPFYSQCRISDNKYLLTVLFYYFLLKCGQKMKDIFTLVCHIVIVYNIFWPHFITVYHWCPENSHHMKELHD